MLSADLRGDIGWRVAASSREFDTYDETRPCWKNCTRSLAPTRCWCCCRCLTAQNHPPNWSRSGGSPRRSSAPNPEPAPIAGSAHIRRRTPQSARDPRIGLPLETLARPIHTNVLHGHVGQRFIDVTPETQTHRVITPGVEQRLQQDLFLERVGAGAEAVERVAQVVVGAGRKGRARDRVLPRVSRFYDSRH